MDSPQIFDSKELVVLTKREARKLVAAFVGHKVRSKQELQQLEAEGVFDIIHSLSEASKE